MALHLELVCLLKKTAVLIVLGCLLLIGCMVEHVSGFQADTWTSKTPMNHARAYLEAAVVNGNIYAIGGDEGSEIGNCMTGTGMSHNVVNYTEEYDPALNIWTEKAAMPTSRALFGTAVFENKIYCIGGYNGEQLFVGPEDYDWKTNYYALSQNELYDPATDTWTSLANMPTPRHSAATNIVNNVIYVMGGHSMAEPYVTYNVTEAYSPQTNTWMAKAPSPFPVPKPASAVIDNKIFVLGEFQYPQSGLVLMVYDPASDSWSIGDKVPLNYPAISIATSGEKAPKRIYFFGENRTDIYDPETNSWSTGNPAPTDRLIAEAAIVDDIIYLIGGRTGQWGYITFMYPSTLNEQYIPINYGQSEEPESTAVSTIMPTTMWSSSPNQTLSFDKQGSMEPFQLTTPIAIVVVFITFACSGIVLYSRKHRHNQN